MAREGNYQRGWGKNENQTLEMKKWEMPQEQKEKKNFSLMILLDSKLMDLTFELKLKREKKKKKFLWAFLSTDEGNGSFSSLQGLLLNLSPGKDSLSLLSQKNGRAYFLGVKEGEEELVINFRLCAYEEYFKEESFSFAERRAFFF